MLNTIERTEAIGAPKRRRLARSEMQAKARAVVLGALALFVLAQVGLNAVIDGVCPELRDPTFEIKYRGFVKLKGHGNPAPATVLFMGSSMTMCGVEAGAVDGPVTQALGRPAVGYNLGIWASGPFSQLLFLDRLLQREAKPDFVVLELTAQFFGHDDWVGELQRFPGQMLSRRDLDTVTRYAADPDEVRRDWLKAYLVPIHGHRLTILNDVARDLVPWNDRLEIWTGMDAHGWGATPPPNPAHRTRVLEYQKTIFAARLGRFQLDQAKLRPLRELCDLLVRERISTILIWMPEGPMMRSYYSSEALLALEREFERIGKAYGFPLVNAHGWMDEDAFCDSVHLAGAAPHEFTARLVREALVPWLQSRSAAD